jgi:secondary thiamine-phosphate synthase enzyme
MKIYQQQIQLSQRRRGFHLITAEVWNALPQLREINIGVCQVFIQHTSASLTINENADPTVRKDFEMYFSKAVPENDPDYLHDDEGPDDMPAHLKAALLGSSVMYLSTTEGLHWAFGKVFTYANTETTAVTVL